MPLQITGRHCSISNSQKEYMDKKVERLRRLCTKIDEMHFTISKEKLHYEVEARFRAGKIVAQATCKAEHSYEAIDLLVDKLEAQITKQKEKRDSAKKHAKSPHKLASRLAADEDIEEEIEQAI